MSRELVEDWVRDILVRAAYRPRDIEAILTMVRLRWPERPQAVAVALSPPVRRLLVQARATTAATGKECA